MGMDLTLWYYTLNDNWNQKVKDEPLHEFITCIFHNLRLSVWGAALKVEITGGSANTKAKHKHVKNPHCLGSYKDARDGKQICS